MLADIQKDGLGGRNLARDWRASEFLEAAWRLSVSRKGREALAVEEVCVARMLSDWNKDQSPTASNWRHGGVYLTTSLTKARSYAQSSGPEMVTFGFELLEGIGATDSPEARAILAQFPEVAAWHASSSQPIVLAVHTLNPDDLRAETGEVASDALAEIEELTPIGSYEDTLEFEYVGVLPFDTCLSLVD
jgi:hypothetical protein